MKYLLLLLIMSACGKHMQPPAQDLRDSDGDTIRNNIDNDKFIASIVTVDEIKATFEFQTGYNKLDKHTYTLSNKTDLEFHSKDLLVKNPLLINDNNFFSEFSKLSINGPVLDKNLLTSKMRVVVNFSKTKNPPKSIYFVKGNTKIKLCDWAETVEFSFTQNDLESLINGNSFLWVSHMDPLLKAEENISLKSYRVFLNKGSQTDVLYISKELSIEQVLNKLKILEYKYIDEENLLTTTIKPDVSQWWIRLLNKSDIVIVHANLRQLSDHYLSGLEKRLGTVSRYNGHPYMNFIMNKNNNARVLLKIRSTRKTANFLETYKDKQVYVGGENKDKYGCREHSRKLSSEFLTDYTYDDFQKTFLVNGLYSQQQKSEEVEIRYLVDETGPFWEVELMQGDHFELSLASIPKDLYSPTGLYKMDQCIGDSRSQSYSNNLQTPERSLILNIEALVEIIPE